MLKFNNYPPQTKEDVEFTDGALLLLEKISTGDDEALKAAGFYAGLALVGNLASIDNDFVTNVGSHLTRRWDDEDERRVFLDGFDEAVLDEQVARRVGVGVGGRI